MHALISSGNMHILYGKLCMGLKHASQLPYSKIKCGYEIEIIGICNERSIYVHSATVT